MKYTSFHVLFLGEYFYYQTPIAPYLFSKLYSRDIEATPAME